MIASVRLPVAGFARLRTSMPTLTAGGGTSWPGAGEAGIGSNGSCTERGVAAVGGAQGVLGYCCGGGGGSSGLRRRFHRGQRGRFGRGKRLKPRKSQRPPIQPAPAAARRNNRIVNDNSAISRANTQITNSAATPTMTLYVRLAPQPTIPSNTIRCPSVTAPTAPPAPSGTRNGPDHAVPPKLIASNNHATGAAASRTRQRCKRRATTRRQPQANSSKGIKTAAQPDVLNTRSANIAPVQPSTFWTAPPVAKFRLGSPGAKLASASPAAMAPAHNPKPTISASRRIIWATNCGDARRGRMSYWVVRCLSPWVASCFKQRGLPIRQSGAHAEVYQKKGRHARSTPPSSPREKVNGYITCARGPNSG